MLFFVQSCCFSCVSVGERSVFSECVSKHKLWVANGACSCCCVPHFESTLSICGVFGAVRGSSSSLLLLLPWDVVPLLGFGAAGCLPFCRDPRGRQAGVWREQNVSITPSARKPSHQQLLLRFSGDWFLMRQFSHHLAFPPADQSGEPPLRIYVAATLRTLISGWLSSHTIDPKVTEFRLLHRRVRVGVDDVGPYWPFGF